MATAGFLLNHTLTIQGDGVQTDFQFKLTKTTILSANGTLNEGGADIGNPIAVGVTSFAGATVSLSGLTVTITFSTAPTGAATGIVQVIYG